MFVSIQRHVLRVDLRQLKGALVFTSTEFFETLAYVHFQNTFTLIAFTVSLRAFKMFLSSISAKICNLQPQPLSLLRKISKKLVYCSLESSEVFHLNETVIFHAGVIMDQSMAVL